MKPYIIFVFENDVCAVTSDPLFVKLYTSLSRESRLKKVLLRGEKSPVSMETLHDDKEMR